MFFYFNSNFKTKRGKKTFRCWAVAAKKKNTKNIQSTYRHAYKRNGKRKWIECTGYFIIFSHLPYGDAAMSAVHLFCVEQKKMNSKYFCCSHCMHMKLVSAEKVKCKCEHDKSIDNDTHAHIQHTHDIRLPLSHHINNEPTHCHEQHINILFLVCVFKVR